MKNYLHLFVFLSIFSLNNLKANNEIDTNFIEDTWIKTNEKFFNTKFEKNKTTITNYDFQSFKVKLKNNTFSTDEKIELYTYMLNETDFNKAEFDLKNILIVLLLKYDTKFYTIPNYYLTNTQFIELINKALLTENDSYNIDKNRKLTIPNDDDFVSKAYNHDSPVVETNSEKEKLENRNNFLIYLKEKLNTESDTFLKVQSFLKN